ncbi:translation initiation factor [Marinomonas sp. 15G1-11]|uniref:Translation initiation factor n=1 Tax=Marinomonas phaeophyticola TaxID=3004091 RepID=A0ABT4JQJ3_9GAMM|nr:translation initiation factor [Marinomonas sp. 15G1-11]MCZ2720287.1 translation initiation factor [Marinomonas sp. 15G1-11]
MSSKLVYSTEVGKVCSQCQQSINDCSCKEDHHVIGSGKVKVLHETKGRKGKGATLITDLALNSTELAKLAKEIKAKCATGGTVKDGIVEIQGDHRDKIIQLLSLKGIRAKKSGG